MVEETIKDIKEVEKEADQVGADAQETCGKILDDANAQAKEIKANAEAEAKEKAQEAMKAAQEAGNASMQSSLDDVEQEIAAMKEAAKDKEDQAVSAVIDALI